jgi:hypothetical protein
MNIATVDKLVLRVREGVLVLRNPLHRVMTHTYFLVHALSHVGVQMSLADGWYWTTTGDGFEMWGPFEMSHDAEEAAWNASLDGVKVHTYIDKDDREFEISEGSVPPGRTGFILLGRSPKNDGRTNYELADRHAIDAFTQSDTDRACARCRLSQCRR